MMNEKLYRETFSRLCASDEAKEEVLMKLHAETKTRRLPKILRGAAIAAMLTVALAVTVSAASGGMPLDEFILTIVSTNGIHQTMVDEAGNEYDIVSIGGGTEMRDGRVILKAMGEEEDITDALENEGKFTKTYDAEGMPVTVNVTGTVEEHTVEIETDVVTVTQTDPASQKQTFLEKGDVNVGLTFASEPMEAADIPAAK